MENDMSKGKVAALLAAAMVDSYELNFLPQQLPGVSIVSKD